METFLFILMAGIPALGLMYLYDHFEKKRIASINRIIDSQEKTSIADYEISPGRKKELFAKYNDYVIGSFKRGKTKEEVFRFLVRDNKMSKEEAKIFFDVEMNAKLSHLHSGNKVLYLYLAIGKIISGLLLFLLAASQGNFSIIGILLMIGSIVWFVKWRE